MHCLPSVKSRRSTWEQWAHDELVENVCDNTPPRRALYRCLSNKTAVAMNFKSAGKSPGKRRRLSN